MTILHIITRMILGGAQRNTVLTCAAQAKAGHEVWLAHGPVYGPEGSMLPEAQRSGARVVEIKAMRRAVLLMHDWLAYRSLRKLIGEVRPDVVQTHSSKAGILGRAAAWSSGVPAVVHTVHGPPFHDRQGALRNRLFIGAERWAARRCHRIVCVAAAMRRQFEAQSIGRPEQFVVVHNGFDVSQYERLLAAAPARDHVRCALGVPPEAGLVGVVGRLDKDKGHDDLLDVFEDSRKAAGDIHLLFVGEGWHGDALRQRVSAAGWGGRVHFTGMVPLARLVELLRAMDVMVLPSYREGLPRTMVEALLCDCAIAGYDVDGMGEICLDGQTGRLVPLADRPALRDAIVWLLQNEDQRRALIERGRQLVHEQFKINAVVKQTQHVYNSVLAARK